MFLNSKNLTKGLFLLSALLITVSSFAQSITGTMSVCAGATTTLSDATTGGTWSTSNTAVATIGSGSGVVTGVSAGTVTISYTVSGSSVTAVVTVNPLPNAGTISGNANLCLGSTITLTSSGSSGGIWSANNSIASVGSTSGVVSAVAIGQDSIKYTVTNSCGSSTAAMNVAIDGQIGYIYTYAGNGTVATAGDGGAAFLCSIQNPRDLVADTSGNVYFCDPTAERVRKISRSGIITTVAGTGGTGNTGDGGPATAATLNNPNGVFVDNAGNIFITNSIGNTVRKINGSTGIITTIA